MKRLMTTEINIKQLVCDSGLSVEKISFSYVTSINRLKETLFHIVTSFKVYKLLYYITILLLYIMIRTASYSIYVSMSTNYF